jgi:hypothetical protein
MVTEREDEEKQKDIHFQVSEKLFDEFFQAFPERGERKIILTQFVKEAIRMQSLKDYFSNLVGKQVLMNRMNGGKDV